MNPGNMVVTLKPMTYTEFTVIHCACAIALNTPELLIRVAHEVDLSPEQVLEIIGAMEARFENKEEEEEEEGVHHESSPN